MLREELSNIAHEVSDIRSKVNKTAFQTLIRIYTSPNDKTLAIWVLATQSGEP